MKNAGMLILGPFSRTGGEASDSRQFETLLDIGPEITPRAVVADKGYDAKANREAARKRGIAPANPYRGNAKDRPKYCSRALCKGRARIEQAMGKLKRFKRVAAARQSRYANAHLDCRAIGGDALREDRQELRVIRGLGLRFHLGQIRPHGLGKACFRLPGRAERCSCWRALQPLSVISRHGRQGSRYAVSRRALHI